MNNFPTSRAPGPRWAPLDPTLARSEASLRLQTWKWAPEIVDEIAKSLVQVTPITMLHDTYNYSIHESYSPVLEFYPMSISGTDVLEVQNLQYTEPM